MASATTQDELVAVLVSILTGPSLNYRHPAILALGEEPVLFRLESSDRSTERVALQELIRFQLRYWRPVGRLWSILGDWSERWTVCSGMERWAPALLAYFACFAWDWGCLLARQMKHPSPPRPCPNADLRKRYHACLRDVKRSRSTLRKRLIDLVASRVQQTGQAPQTPEVKMVHFAPEGSSTSVRWLAADGTEVGHSTLEAWIQQLGASKQLAACVEELRQDQQRQQSYADEAQEMLAATSPPLAAAVQAACETRALAGHVFCNDLAVHGLPANVTFYADPGIRDGEPRLTIRALRACEEFVLQDAIGQLYYFPPCQLAAHVDYAATDNLWRIPRPHVRVPCNSPRWTHPYSGSLYMDPFARAEMFTPACPEPMVAPSPQGEKLVPARVARHTEAAATDLCLADQERAISVLESNVRDAERAGREPDLFGLMWGLWDLVAVGLTHGAVSNEGRPRIEFGGPLFYPVKVNQLAGTPLAARVIAYDPARKVI